MKKNISCIAAMNCIAIIILVQIPKNVFSQQARIGNIGPLPTPAHQGPQCQFSVLNSCYGDTSYFVNQTIRMMNPSWEIADSTGILFTSTDTNIKYLFPYPGTYSVTLRANNGHPDSITKPVIMGNTTVADFQFQQCTQQFVNMSSCATGYYWDFGDGNFSSLSLPAHQYADTGYYTISLIAFKGLLSDTFVQTIQVNSRGFPNANFTFLQSNDTVYFFTDTLADNYTWDFGDQTTSILKQPAHIFPDTGYYDVSLVVSNFCGIALNFLPIYVASTSGFSDLYNPHLDLSVYPNPVSNVEFLNYRIYSLQNSDSKITLLNIFGQRLMNIFLPLKQGITTGVIDLSSFNKGLLIVLIETDHDKQFKKILIR